MFLVLLITKKCIAEIHSQVISFCTSLFAMSISFTLILIFETPTMPANVGCWGLFLCHRWSTAFSVMLHSHNAQRIPVVFYSIIRSTMISCLAGFQYTVLISYQPGRRNRKRSSGSLLCYRWDYHRPTGQVMDGTKIEGIRWIWKHGQLRRNKGNVPANITKIKICGN